MRYVGALQFHHRDPATKAFEVSRQGITRSLDRLRLEARKCVLLCANCHAMVEAGLLLLPAGAHERVVHLKGTFGGSSTAEHSAVNRRVVGSNPTPRASRGPRREMRASLRFREVCRRAELAGLGTVPGNFRRICRPRDVSLQPFPAKEPPCQGAGRPSRDESARCPSRIRKREENHAEAGHHGRARGSGMCRHPGGCSRADTGTDSDAPAGRGEVREDHAQRFPRRADEPRRVAGRARAAYGADRRDSNPSTRRRAATSSRRR